MIVFALVRAVLVGESLEAERCRVLRRGAERRRGEAARVLVEGDARDAQQEADALEARRSIIDSDAPDHTRLRRLVSKAFTPRNIRVWEDTTRAIAAELLDEFVAAGAGTGSPWSRHRCPSA